MNTSNEFGIIKCCNLLKRGLKYLVLGRLNNPNITKEKFDRLENFFNNNINVLTSWWRQCVKKTEIDQWHHYQDWQLSKIYRQKITNTINTSSAFSENSKQIYLDSPSLFVTYSNVLVNITHAYFENYWSLQQPVYTSKM